MATRLENLNAAYDGYAAQLASLAVNPKPSYEIDGQIVKWGEFQEMLLKQMKMLRIEIDEAGGADTLFMEETQVYVAEPTWPRLGLL